MLENEYLDLNKTNFELERKIKYIFHNKQHLLDIQNKDKKLEFIGKSVLDIYMSYRLLELNKYDLEVTKLERIKKKITYNNLIFKEIEENIGMVDIVLYLIGAIYKDSKDIGISTRFISEVIEKEMKIIINKFKISANDKNKLQELIVNKYKIFPTYTYEKDGNNIVTNIKIDNNISFKGSGKTKKESEKETIKNALKSLT